jgi:hypothetical protein
MQSLLLFDCVRIMPVALFLKELIVKDTSCARRGWHGLDAIIVQRGSKQTPRPIVTLLAAPLQTPETINFNSTLELALDSNLI